LFGKPIYVDFLAKLGATSEADLSIHATPPEVTRLELSSLKNNLFSCCLFSSSFN
jgi:hypothetical protein